MVTVKRTVTKEIYDELKALEPVKRKEAFEKYLDICILCGYGYYGFYGPFEEGGTYFVEYVRGSTCD